MPYNLPQRKSPRATWHDYNGANYFVTFCTKNRELYFGDVVDGGMELSEIGRWASFCIDKIPEINDDVLVLKSVVMSNHVHMILSMPLPMEYDDMWLPQCERLPQCDSPTDLAENVCSDIGAVGLPYHDSRNVNNPEINEEMQRRAMRCGRLSHIIGQYKGAVTKYANEHDVTFAWQSRYHDHIIRNQSEMNRIADYIENNPIKWELDRFYKKR